MTHITYAGVDANSIQLNLNHDLDNLNKWLISNKLTLNSAKTEFMLIGSRQKLSTLPNPLKLSIDNVAIGHVSSFKSLGIFIDENVRWQTRVDKLSKDCRFWDRSNKKELDRLSLHLLFIRYTMH